MKGFVRVVGLPNKWIGMITSYTVVVFATITMIEVFLRFGFNNPTNWAHETTEQLFGFYIIMGGGWALLYKAHIRIDVFWSRLSPRKRAAVDLATDVIALLFLGLLLWFSVRMAWYSVAMFEHSPTPWGPPTYPLKVSLAVGAALLLLQFIAKAIADFYLALTGAEYA